MVAKNKPFLVVEPKRAYTSYIFPNPRPNPEFWGNEGSGILVVAADTKRILLGLRSKDVNEPFTWGNFGGAIGIDDYGNKEAALSPLKNALKEMKEEIGYSGKITPYKSYTFKSESFIYHNFIGVVPKEAMVKLDQFNWEVSELKWFTMEEIKQLPNLHFGLRSLLDNANPLYSIPIMANPHYTPPPNVAMFPGEMPQGPAALYQQTISISQLNPPRSKPFPWNKERVKRSPLKTMKRAKATYKAWKEGKPIGFSATTSLKSMGKIPRASGKYELGDKYVRINPVRAPTPHTMMVRHEIGTLEGPYGHVIEGGKLEDLGLAEIITVDTVREPDTNKFLLGLYEGLEKVC